MADDHRAAVMSTEELRASFLAEGLFEPGTVRLLHTDLDRLVLGGAVPLATELPLAASPELRAEYFAERREIGVLNVGGAGAVAVDGRRYDMALCDCLYIGKGSRNIVFSSVDAGRPARYFLASYRADAELPTRHIAFAQAETVELGRKQDANERTIYKYIHPDGAASCQLVMGFTALKEGSVWNTMPPHTHTRRSEVYFYFGLSPDAAVMHFMGAPSRTRHLVVRNEQAVLSPPWSIHCGVGTQAYKFAWCMGGENQTFADMDLVPVASLY